MWVKCCVWDKLAGVQVEKPGVSAKIKGEGKEKQDTVERLAGWLAGGDESGGREEGMVWRREKGERCVEGWKKEVKRRVGGQRIGGKRCT